MIDVDSYRRHGTRWGEEGSGAVEEEGGREGVYQLDWISYITTERK